MRPNVRTKAPAKARPLAASAPPPASGASAATSAAPTPAWRLQDAKARFSEVVRLAGTDGPQHITVHGREAVVIVDAQQFRRLQGEPSGARLVQALAASPHPEIELEALRLPMPVRDVAL